MFGRPQWFREKRFGWGLRPIAWQGWMYALIWGIVMAAPVIALALMGKVLEGGIWLAVTLGMLLWDVRQIVGELREAQRERDVFVIDDDTDSTQINTEKYEFRLRDR